MGKLNNWKHPVRIAKGRRQMQNEPCGKRHYDVLDEIAKRLVQYELPPNEVTTEESRKHFFERYTCMYTEIVVFWQMLDKMYPPLTLMEVSDDKK